MKDVSENYEVVKYDHAKVRFAMDRVFSKFPREERYPRMVSAVKQMLARAEKYGTRHAVKFQQDCLDALLKDRA